MNRLLLAAFCLCAIFLGACEGNSDKAEPVAPAAEPAPAVEETPPAEPEPAEAPQATGTLEIPSHLDDPVVATVNQAPITRQLLESQVVMAESGRMIFGDELTKDEDPAAQTMREEADLALRREVLSGLISLELACQEALKMGYAPTDEEVKAALSQLRNDYGDDDQLHKALDQYGETEDELRAQLRKTMALKKWQDSEFLAKVEIPEAEAQAFYQANLDSMRHGEMLRASQIFISIPIGSPPLATEQARAQAQAALDALNAGEPFEETALRFSNDPEAAETGGDLGWLDRESSASAFNEVIFNLENGAISELVETPLGFYIFKVTDRREAGVDPFETARGDIVEYLAEEQLTEAVRQRMLELEAAADIQILDPKLKEIMQIPAAEAAEIPSPTPVN